MIINPFFLRPVIYHSDHRAELEVSLLHLENMKDTGKVLYPSKGKGNVHLENKRNTPKVLFSAKGKGNIHLENKRNTRKVLYPTKGKGNFYSEQEHEQEQESIFVF